MSLTYDGDSMKVLEVYEAILRDTVKGMKNLDVIDILLHAVVIHTHSIVVRSDIELEDLWENRGPPFVLAPVTRWHAAELLAVLWPPTKERGQQRYWHDRYELNTPYELFSDVSAEHRERALAAKKHIEQHLLVAELLEE
jgi:hypothetical protein